MYQHPIFDILQRAESYGNTAADAGIVAAVAKQLRVSYDRSSLAPLYDNGSLYRLTHPGTGLPVIARPTGIIGDALCARFLASTGNEAGRPPLPMAAPKGRPLGASQSHAWGILANAPTLAPAAALCGRPGTGKTYLIAQMIHALLDAGIRVEVAAPTGKAASVLAMKLEQRTEVVTIHRLIGLIPGQFPARNKHNPLDARVVVIDESSMIDSTLMGQLLDAINPKRTFVIFVGDPWQLSPVGNGSPFADMVNFKLVPVAELTEIQRQAEGNGIIQMATAFSEGRLVLPEKNVYHFKLDASRLNEEAVNLYCSDRLKEKFGLTEIQREFLVLSPVKQEKFDASTASINASISHRLLPARDLGRSKFARGDRIIFTVNNYTHGFVNGELGVLEDYQSAQRGGRGAPRPSHARIRNDHGKTYELDDYSLGQYADWAYALTVHKAQGSECRVVALLLEPGARHMYTRNLVYTALTRAREELLIFGDLKVLEDAVKRPESRVTALPALISLPDVVAKVIASAQPTDLGGYAADYT